MEILESVSLTKLLAENQTWSQEIFSTFVDNMHFPYITVPKKYILPSVPILGVEETSARQFLLATREFFPEKLKEFTVLNPVLQNKRERSKLSLVKILNINNFNYLVKLTFEILYLGGASKDEIINLGNQSFSSSVFTDRIYFNFKIFLLDSFLIKHNQLIEFKLSSFSESIYKKLTEIVGKKFHSELFDEIDYTHILEPIYTKLELLKFWKLGKVYQPLQIENHSLSICFLNFNIQENINNFISFHTILNDLTNNKDLNSNTLKNFYNWLEKFSFQRITSKSGNIAWKIFYFT